MLKIEFTNQFKKDFKLIKKRGYDIKKFIEVVELLQKQETLPAKYKDHQLTNSRDYKDVRECHIEPDWLLVYRIKNEILILELSRTGTHSDLFK
ncbi:type II toxin-antitoxin system YafQ family toxin [Fusobacterium sp.]|uniref:type II toxin-antitoxin system YafQ family toxin n=1 Tax=Fusobacterium sp. TaxID=68766 RepID=UPI00263393DF|nr:type II toxin-antitoxin system YafQ family toxin [Fusobacterium sp.]